MRLQGRFTGQLLAVLGRISRLTRSLSSKPTATTTNSISTLLTEFAYWSREALDHAVPTERPLIGLTARGQRHEIGL